MAGDALEATTIEELIASGAIVAHKDGNYGLSYPRVEEFGTDGVPFLTAKSLREGYVDIAGAPRLGDARGDELTFGFVQTDDVLLSHNATIGRVAVVPQHKGRLLVGTSLTYFRLNPQKLLPRYLAVYFAGADFQNQLVAVMSHSTRNQVPVTAQRKLHVVVPPHSEQKAIASVLGALDDKIELNRRMNATLESMARALFQSCFVDFDPVRVKLDGRPPAALDPATAALFPEHVEDSPFGHIPKGWSAQRLPDAIEVNPRRTLKSGAIAPYLDMKNLPTQGHSAEEVIDREFSSGTKFQNGDTLLARITPCLENGKTGYVDFLEDGQVGWGSTESRTLATLRDTLLPKLLSGGVERGSHRPRFGGRQMKVPTPLQAMLQDHDDCFPKKALTLPHLFATPPLQEQSIPVQRVVTLAASVAGTAIGVLW